MFPPLLSLALACASDQPTTVELTVPTADPIPVEDLWKSAPIIQGQWPDWVTDSHKRLQRASSLGDGSRRLIKVLGPEPSLGPLDDPKWELQAPEYALWRVEIRPAEQPNRIWEVELRGDAVAAVGEPITVQPSGALLSGRSEPGLVEGRLEVGSGAWTFRCLGQGADLSPDGWCADFFGQTWIETWEG